MVNSAWCQHVTDTKNDLDLVTGLSWTTTCNRAVQ